MGAYQSPIDIIKPIGSPELRPLIFEYQPVGLDIKFDGNIISAIPHGPVWVRDDSQKYQLQNISFHTPSEHKVNGDSYDGEIHLMHRGGGQTIIIAVFVLDGSKHRGLQKLLERLPRRAGAMSQVTDLDLKQLLPRRKTYYRYIGSITYPPCTEGVTWYVLRQPIYLSSFQLDQLELSQGKNNRPVQGLGQRIPLESR